MESQNEKKIQLIHPNMNRKATLESKLYLLDPKISSILHKLKEIYPD